MKDENYPFSSKGKISIKFGKSKKVRLNEAEIKRVSELDMSEELAHLNNSQRCFHTVSPACVLRMPYWLNRRIFRMDAPIQITI